MVVTMAKQGMMMGPMRGHLAPNSSPFKITTNKLSSQYMIQDHMSNHYTKLGTAKAAIDNKPPKSMATSVKKRDQMRREAMAKQMKLFDFEKEMKHGSSTPHRQTPDSSIYGSQQRLFSVTVSKSGYDEPRPQSVSSLRSGKVSPRRPRSASSPRSTRSDLNSPRDQTKKSDILTQTYSGDYLDRHEERFKNVDTPFAPRLKKRPGKSYLSKSKHYAPPLVMDKGTKRKTSFIKLEKRVAEEVSPTSSTSDIEGHERSISREMEQRMNSTMEPPIDLAQTYVYGDSRVTYDNIYPRQRSQDAYGFQHTLENDSFFGRSSLRKSFTRNETFSNETKNRIEAEEEELKYLEFINSVTNDILTRGIYSDRVLRQVMQRHLDQNRGRLNEGRMRHMLTKLQEDLGVPSEITLQGFSTTAKYVSDHDAASTVESDYRSRRKEKRSESESSVSRKLSYGNTSPKKLNTRRAEGTTSDGSDGGGPLRRKGILKTPATSSGSDLDLKSATLSSGDEDARSSKSKQVTVANSSKRAVGKDKDIEKDKTEIVQLINGLGLNERDIAKEIGTQPKSPPKAAKRTSIGSGKTMSSVHSLVTDEPEEDSVKRKRDKQEKNDLELDSDLDDF